jgi:hypothetical protein
LPYLQLRVNFVVCAKQSHEKLKAYYNSQHWYEISCNRVFFLRRAPLNNEDCALFNPRNYCRN